MARELWEDTDGGGERSICFDGVVVSQQQVVLETQVCWYDIVDVVSDNQNNHTMSCDCCVGYCK